jgi:hypothetical protein
VSGTGWLADALAGRGVFAGAELRPSEQELILAADSQGRWGGLFRFSLGADGDWFCDCLSAQRHADGRWEELGSGGSYGGAWEVPWRPPDDGWDGAPILVMMVAGQTVFDDADQELNLRVIGGFVAPSVNGLLLRDGDHERHVPVTSPVGAFAVASVARGAATLIPVGPDGTPIHPGRQIQ